jgi:uncharacterized protein (DUF433 family)
MATLPSPSSPVVGHSHIEVTPGTCSGKPRIAGHRIRVQDVVLWTEEGRSADEIVAGFPQLSLGDVYAALAYYHDHREQVDRDIRADHEFLQRLKPISSSDFPDREKDAHGGDPLPS